MRFSGCSGFVAVALTIMSAGLLSADQITYSATVPQQTTNFTASVGFAQFDPSLGTLTSIDFYISGDVGGNVRLESLDGAATSVTTQMGATVALRRPDNTILVAVLPLASSTSNFTAFDGVIDFGGTSGATLNNLTSTASDSASSTAASDLSLFTGTGTIYLPVTAVGQSSATGSGNLITQFQLKAGAITSITYNYTAAPVPEPSSSLLFGLGLVGLPLLRRLF